MFIAPLVQEAKRLGVTLPSARERYVAYRFYPLIEHVQVLVETSQRVYPGVPLRQALRKLGRGAPTALVASTLGKVVLAAAAGAHDVIDAMAKAYPHGLGKSKSRSRPCRRSRNSKSALLGLGAKPRAEDGAGSYPLCGWHGGGGTSSAGFPSKNPVGFRLKPTHSTDMTGQSSGRTSWCAPNVYQTTKSALTRERFFCTYEGKPPGLAC